MHPSHHAWTGTNGYSEPDGKTILKANDKLFRVIGVDTFNNEDWVYNDWVYNEYATLDLAKQCASAHGSNMLMTHVYDDQGKHLFQAGKY